MKKSSGPETYRGISYYVMRSSISNKINIVQVYYANKTYEFETIKTAKRFIAEVAYPCRTQPLS